MARECENTLCVYCEAGICLLDEIAVDSLGHCAACMTINVDQIYLKKSKEELRKRLLQDF